MPTKRIPCDLPQINGSENCQDNEIDPDRGPLDVDEIAVNAETELSSTVLNPINLKPQKQLIIDELLQNKKIN